jgi:hypothetical protein
MIGIIPTGFIGIGRNDDSCTLPLLEYIIGISFIDFRMKIERNTNQRTITNINTITPHILVEPETSPYTC